MRNEHQSDAQAFILCGLFKYMHKHKQTQRNMYLTDLTDAQKEYIKGTSKNKIFVCVAIIV